MTGELKRQFLKHKVFGSVFAVEADESGHVLAAVGVSEASSCRHQLPTLKLDLEAAAQINEHVRDYSILEPTCAEPTHLLADIGLAEKECEIAEAEFDEAHRHARSLKEIFELKQDRLRQIVRDATNPKPLPLFEETSA